MLKVWQQEGYNNREKRRAKFQAIKNFTNLK